MLNFQVSCQLKRWVKFRGTKLSTGWSRIIGTVRGNVDVATVLLMPRLQNPTSFIKTTFFNPLLHENSINIVQNFEKSCQ